MKKTILPISAIYLYKCSNRALRNKKIDLLRFAAYALGVCLGIFWTCLTTGAAWKALNSKRICRSVPKVSLGPQRRILTRGGKQRSPSKEEFWGEVPQKEFNANSTYQMPSTKHMGLNQTGWWQHPPRARPREEGRARPPPGIFKMVSGVDVSEYSSTFSE